MYYSAPWRAINGDYLTLWLFDGVVLKWKGKDHELWG